MNRSMFLFVLPLLVTLVILGCGREKSKSADQLAPTLPNGIAITAVSSSEIKISWNPSADDSGKIKGYKIYKNGKYLQTVKTTSFSDIGLSPQVKFCYRISAFDEAGNESGQSAEVCAIL